MITVFSGINTIYKLLSSEQKPQGCRNGDMLYEMDTGALLRYNGETSEWNVFRSEVNPASNLVGSGRVGYMVI